MRLASALRALVAGVQPFHRYISSESSLPARDREILILRIAGLSRSNPVWNACAAGAGRRTDPHRRGPHDRVGPATWARLATPFDDKQRLDVLITAGGYRMVSMSLNTFGVAAEPNSEPLPR